MNYKRAAFVISIGSILAILGTRRHNKQMQQTFQMNNNKLSDNYLLLNHWLEIKNEGHSAAEYFEHMGYKHIAVYGMAELADRLFEELENTDICIDYGIDRDVSCTNSRIKEIYSLQDNFPMVDVIVVMPYYAFDSICMNLKGKIECPVISIEDVIWSI